MSKTLTFVKRDQYDMPIYIDEEGVYWIDIDCRKDKPELYVCRDNNPEGGPDDPISPNIECIFKPKRERDPADTQLKIIYFI